MSQTIHSVEVIEGPGERRPCTLLGECVIEPGTIEDWRPLAIYHYRSHAVASTRAYYRARHVPSGTICGVIVYSSPSLNNSARNQVLGDIYLPGSNIGKAFMAKKLNAEIELILRVVIHPTFRGCGLGVRLVAETLPLRPVRYVESSSAMGAVNPFFEHAGMTAYHMEPSGATGRVLAALRAFGFSNQDLSDPRRMTERVAGLGEHRALVERELVQYERFWLGRTILDEAMLTPERAIRRVAANALMRPVYFLWKNHAWQPATPRSPGEPVPESPAA